MLFTIHRTSGEPVDIAGVQATGIWTTFLIDKERLPALIYRNERPHPDHIGKFSFAEVLFPGEVISLDSLEDLLLLTEDGSQILVTKKDRAETEHGRSIEGDIEILDDHHC